MGIISNTTATPATTPSAMKSMATGPEEVWSVGGMGDGEVNWRVAVEVGEGLERVWRGRKRRQRN